jgi:vitamin K-dependent gamma-carboxylase-like protein
VSELRRRFEAGWERFLFAPVDALSVAVFRIILGAALAANFRIVGNIAPRFAASPLLRDLYHAIFLTSRYHAGCIALIVLFAAGVRPRLLGFMLAVFLTPLDFVSFGHQSRQMLIFALVAFSFLHSDRRLAIGTRSAHAAETAGPRWPMRLIQIQLSLVYGINALAKTTPAYLRGDVLIGMSRMLPNFHLDFSAGFVHLGGLAIPIAVAATLSVAIEYALAIGFWFPHLRWPTAILGIAYHLMLMWIMRIYMLDWTSIAMYPAFLLPLQRDQFDSYLGAAGVVATGRWTRRTT